VNSLKEIFLGARNYSTALLIQKLNPILRGWANYHQCVVASEMFKKLDRYVFLKVWNWVKKKGKKGKGKGKKYLRNKYFKTVAERNWVFHAVTDSGKEVQLFNLKRVPIRRHKLGLD